MPCVDGREHIEEANRIAKVNSLTRMLCEAMNIMPARLIYMMSRELQDWWAAHQADDRARRGEERAAAEREQIRLKALAKLTVAEREALGVKK